MNSILEDQNSSIDIMKMSEILSNKNTDEPLTTSIIDDINNEKCQSSDPICKY